jgi:Flp pilus assembly protein TadD
VRSFRNTEDPSFLNTYGWVRFKQGSLDEAVSYLQRAVSADPTAIVMRYHLGMVLYERGDLEQAQSELAVAVGSDEAFPGREEAERALAEIERSRG